MFKSYIRERLKRSLMYDLLRIAKNPSIANARYHAFITGEKHRSKHETQTQADPTKENAGTEKPPLQLRHLRAKTAANPADLAQTQKLPLQHDHRA